MDLSRDLTLIVVGDLTFGVKMDYGRYKKLAREQAKLPTSKQRNEETGEEEDVTDPDAALDFMDATLREVIVNVTGLTRDGQQVAWTPDLLDELPLGTVQELFAGVCNPGQAPNPTISAATSPERPAS